MDDAMHLWNEEAVGEDMGLEGSEVDFFHDDVFGGKDTLIVYNFQVGKWWNQLILVDF